MATKTKSQRKILNISLPPRLYFDIEKWAKKGAMTKAEFVRDAVRSSLQSEKDWEAIFRAGEKAAKKIGIKNDDDIERIVDEVRCSR